MSGWRPEEGGEASGVRKEGKGGGGPVLFSQRALVQ